MEQAQRSQREKDQKNRRHRAESSWSGEQTLTADERGWRWSDADQERKKPSFCSARDWSV